MARKSRTGRKSYQTQAVCAPARRVAAGGRRVSRGSRDVSGELGVVPEVGLEPTRPFGAPDFECFVELSLAGNRA